MPENKTRLVPIVVKKGEPPVWFETSEAEPTVIASQGHSGWVPASAEEETLPPSLDEALERIRPLIESLFEKISGIVHPPKEISLDLGVKLSGKVGFFVAESQGEASVAISLKWGSSS